MRKRPFTKAHVIDKVLRGAKNAPLRGEEYCFERLQEPDWSPEEKASIHSTIIEIRKVYRLMDDIHSDFLQKVKEKDL